MHLIPTPHQMCHSRLRLHLLLLLSFHKRLFMLHEEEVFDEGCEGVVEVVVLHFVVGGDGHFADKLIHIACQRLHHHHIILQVLQVWVFHFLLKLREIDQFFVPG